jgi:hypothetical protein
MPKSHDKIQDGFIASKLNILHLKGAIALSFLLPERSFYPTSKEALLEDMGEYFPDSV